MVILILIILLCFKLYIKNVNNTHLTIMLVIVFGLYETYYYKENFQTQPSSLDYDYNGDILQHKDNSMKVIIKRCSSTVSIKILPVLF